MSNTITFVGRLGRDAELRDAGSTKVCSFSAANDQGFGDKKTSIWFKCSLWGKQGESLSKYLVKGQQVYVSGELTLREYDSKDGAKKTSAEVRVNSIDLVGGKKDREESHDAPATAPAPVHQEPAPSSEMPF